LISLYFKVTEQPNQQIISRYLIRVLSI